MTIKLGDKARDTITGLIGTVVSRHEYLNGCVRLSLQPHEVKDGKPVESSAFDIETLEQLESAEDAPPRLAAATRGSHDEPLPPGRYRF